MRLLPNMIYFGERRQENICISYCLYRKYGDVCHETDETIL